MFDKFNSHRQMHRLPFSMVTGISLALIVGCGPTSETATTSTVTVAEEVPDVDTALEVVIEPGDQPDVESMTVSLLGEEYVIGVGSTEPVDPAAWQSIQNSVPETPDSIAYLLQSANILLDEMRIEEAEIVLSFAASVSPAVRQTAEFKLVNAKMQHLSLQHRRAVRTLTSIITRSTSVDLEFTLEALRIRAAAYAALGQQLDMAFDLIKLHELLEDGAERTDVGHQVWASLRRLTPEELSVALTNTADRVAQQWLQLSLSTAFVLENPFQYATIVSDWMQNNPAHPAQSFLRSSLLPGSFSDLSDVTSIALLLPLSSSIEQAAYAFLDGFVSQSDQDSNPIKPTVQIYDTGSAPELIFEQYNQAVNEGADFIVGPLGLRAVENLVSENHFPISTLILGDAGNVNLPAHVFQFSYAPELDGIATAERAWRDGHSSVSVLFPQSAWGERIYESFAQTWTQMGGHIINRIAYDENTEDFSHIVKDLLNIKTSAKRYSTLRDAAGQSMKFTPRRRQDIDFIFLVATPEKGRLLKPHIDFYRAHDLPVYSTRRIFSGAVNPINDRDLNGIRFADAAWLIDDSRSIQYLREKFPTSWSKASNLDRLFAMGIDVYNLISRLNIMQESPDRRFHGVTSILRMDEQQRIVQDSVWGEFRNGVPAVLSDLSTTTVGRLPFRRTPPIRPQLLERDRQAQIN